MEHEWVTREGSEPFAAVLYVRVTGDSVRDLDVGPALAAGDDEDRTAPRAAVAPTPVAASAPPVMALLPSTSRCVCVCGSGVGTRGVCA
jgi:hypothetical protein